MAAEYDWPAVDEASLLATLESLVAAAHDGAYSRAGLKSL